MVARWLRVSAAGAVEIAGRRGARLALSASASPASESPSQDPHGEDPARRWRETVRVRAIDGEVVLDAASGALLAARFSAAYTFERDGKGPFVVNVTYNMTTVAPRAIAPPEEFVADPSRPRPMLDRQALLDGLGDLRARGRR